MSGDREMRLKAGDLGREASGDGSPGQRFGLSYLPISLYLPISFLAAGLLLGASAPTPRGVKAFPTAEGFGASAKGGRGGKVVYVTTLEDYDPRTRTPVIPGSLRWALEHLEGPRIVVFKTGGNILLKRPIRMIGEEDSCVTVAGQSAPGDGIALVNFGVSIEGAHDIVLRHVRVRVGLGGLKAVPDGDIDGLVVYKHAHHVIVDHCSFAWATDENVDFLRAHDLTIQNSVIAEGIWDGKEEVPHSMGMLVGDVERVSIHRNYFLSNWMRHPVSGAGDPRVINNLIYNWNFLASLVGGTVKHTPDFIGNTYQWGPQTAQDPALRRRVKSIYVTNQAKADLLSLHVQDNVALDEAGKAAPFYDPADPFSLVGVKSDSAYSKRLVPNALQPDHPVTLRTAAQAKDWILAHAGVTKPLRDPVDAKLIDDFRNGTGRIPRKADDPRPPPLASGTPPPDTDADGMPDAWEKARGLNPDDPADGPQTAGNGYTNVENYLNELAGDP